MALFRDHSAKSGLNALTTWTAAELAQVPAGWQVDFGDGLDALKLRALYVDFIDGAWVTPAEIEELKWWCDGLIHSAIRSHQHYATQLVGITEEGYDDFRDCLRGQVDRLLSDPKALEDYLQTPQALANPEVAERLRLLARK